ncbi:MAG: two-component sensor histidine kinase [Paludibacteraceae bacterium]|nr:two-component sensor histidine kinase [Paludibacteraceae bacterium]
MILFKKLIFSFLAIFLFFAGIIFIINLQYEKHMVKERYTQTLQFYTDIIELNIQTSTDIKIPDAFVSELQNKDVYIAVFDSVGKSVYATTTVTDSLMCEVSKAALAVFNEKATNENTLIVRQEQSKKSYFYFGKKYGEQTVLASIPYHYITSDVWNIRNFTASFFMLFVLSLASMAFYLVSNKLLNTVKNLKKLIIKIENKEETEDDLLFFSQEFKEISSFIVNTYKNLSTTKDALSLEKEKLFKHLQISQEGLAIYTFERKEILANEIFIQYINLISNKKISTSDSIFSLAEFSPITSFLNDNQYNKNKSNEVKDKIVEIEKNDYTLLVRCIIFQDKTFEISINDISKQIQHNFIKKQLTQNISHELKTPVSSIQGFMETLIENPDMEQEKKDFFIKRCHAQAIRLSYLLRDISLLNTLDEGSYTVEKEALVLNDIIEGVLQDVSLEIEEKNIHLEVFLKPNMAIMGNYSLLYSVFRNFIDNSLHYAGDNISIIINCYRTDKDFYYFSYADTGGGVSENHLNRIFDRFYRIDKGRSRKMGGTGLGLAIVKNAIAFHQGRVSAKPHETGGLEFLFTLKKQ